MEVKGLASQWACTVYSSHASRSVKVKQLSAWHLLQPLKPRHMASREWLTERTRFELYKRLRYYSGSYFFQNAFVRCHYSSAPSLKMDTKNTTACRVPFLDSMPSFMNFRRVLDLLEFKNQVSQCFAGNQRCPGVWNSLPFLVWDLSMHPRTHIWFFNQFICTGACACSSNLNYAHKCIENSVNA